jgi:hypothetical protein
VLSAAVGYIDRRRASTGDQEEINQVCLLIPPAAPLNRAADHGGRMSGRFDDVWQQNRLDFLNRAGSRWDDGWFMFGQPAIEGEQMLRASLPPRALLPQIDDASGLLVSLDEATVAMSH